MSSVAALNRPQRCAQELSDFDCAMGWAFQELTVHDDEHEDEDVDRVHRDLKRREHTHTAFDKRVEIPADFVAPRRGHSRPTTFSHHQHASTSKKTKKTTVHSAAYSKRATGPTAAQRPATASSAHRRGRSRSPSPPRDHERAVDFVYDVGVRRALRERMDAERLATLREASLRETTLRAERKWVTGDHDAGHKAAPHRQAWPQEACVDPATARPRKPRPASAKTAIAPNVSEWRTQETPFHAATPAAQRAQRRERDQHKRAQQQREAHEVAMALDAFERQWT